MNVTNVIGILQAPSGIHEGLVPANAAKTARRDADATLVVGHTSGGAEKANLSAVAGMLAGALTGSDVRMDRVSQLQQALAAGSYHVSASDVAGKMLSALMN